MKNQIQLYVDGSFRKNGKAGIGVYCKNDKIHLEYQELIPEAKTNNEAEYWAIATALNLAKTFSEYEKIIICSDSKLAVNQINGKYEINKEKLKELKTLVCGIISIWHTEFGREVKVRYVPREKNREADKLAQEITAKSNEKEYDIWSEGYLCTGMEGRPAGAHFYGKCSGKNFKEACINFFIEKKNDKHDDFDQKTMTIWGCRLFDNEEKARRSFG